MANHNAKQPEPVLTRAGVVTALSVLSALLVHVGGGDVSAWLGAHADAVAGVLLAVGPVVSGWLARAHVTPLASPKDATGSALVPQETALPAPAPATVADASDIKAS